MIYTGRIMDLQNKLLGASSHIPITFTVKNIKGDWFNLFDNRVDRDNFTKEVKGL